jgi:hypothetical protein
MENSPDFGTLLGSTCPIVVAAHADADAVMRGVRQVAGALDVPVWTWSPVTGLARDGWAAQPATRGLPGALAFIGGMEGPALIVLLDARAPLTNPLTLRRLAETARGMGTDQTLLVIRPTESIPPELSELAETWHPAVESLRVVRTT